MDIRLIRLEEDIKIVDKWWKHHGWNAPPRVLLPKLGIMVEDAGKPVAAGWIMQTDMPACFIEWITRDPALSKEEAQKALDLLLQTLLKAAKLRGYTHYVTFLENESLKKTFKKHGAVLGDPNLQSFVGAL